MIANIFLPERYGSFFLFPQRVASVMIHATAVRATIVRIVRSQRFIEELIEEPISADQSSPLTERSIAALSVVLARIPSSCRLVGILSSTQVICKLIETPLMSLAKIKRIVPFEVESSLPFALESALIDCIIIGVDTSNKRAHVLVIATQQETVNEYRALFEAAGRMPDVITTDVIALFGFATELSHIPLKQMTPGILLCVDQHMTTLMLFQEERLIAIRIIPRGQADVFIGEQMNQEAFQFLVQDITNTIASFPHFSSAPLESRQLFICGVGADYKEFCEWLSKSVVSECTLLTINKVLHSGTIQSNLGLTNSMLPTVAASLPSMSTEAFNLDRSTAQLHEEQLLRKQLIAGGIILSLLLFILVLVRTITVRSFATAVAIAEKETIETVIKQLHLEVPASSRKSVDIVNRLAQAEVDKRKNIWFSLTTQSRSTPLIILQELSKRINREELGLKLQTLVFSEDTKILILEGEVKSFDALKKLEDSLRQSAIFKLEATLQELEFTAKIVLDITAGATGI